MRRYGVASGLALSCFVLPPSYGGQRQDTVSRVFGVEKSQTLKIDGDHEFTALQNDEFVLTDSLPTNHPFKELNGTCVGMIERSTSVFELTHGECVYENAKGGRWRLTWRLGDKPDADSYTVSGIGGDAAGWKGEGRWQIQAWLSQHRFDMTLVGWIESP